MRRMRRSYWKKQFADGPEPRCGTKRFDDEVKAVVSEVHLISNEHCWCAEDPAPGGRFRFGFQLGDHGVRARALKEQLGVKARPFQDIDQYRTLRKVFGLAPDRGEDRGHVLCASAILDGDQRPSIQLSKIKGLRVRVSSKIDLVSPSPSLQIRARIFALVPAFDCGRPVA